MRYLTERRPFLFGPESPIECYKLNIMGIFYIIFLLAAMIINSTILWALVYQKKETKRSLHYLIMAHSILNLLGSMSDMPFIILSSFACRWLFSNFGCIFTGFMYYFVGTSSINIMVVISIERYLSTIEKGYSNFQVSLLICFSLFSGLFWASSPMLGWSYYSLEISKISCSVEWFEKSLNVISYNISIFVFILFIPIGIISVTNIKIYLSYKSVKQEGDKNSGQEIYLGTLITVYIALFIMTWLPYAFVAFVSAFVPSIQITPFLATFPGLFAKTSAIWSSLYYILTDESIKVTIKKQLFKGNIAVSRNTTGHGGETFSMEDNEIEDEGCTACNDTAV